MAQAEILRVACIGGGVIGAGWVGRLLENGIDVNLFDPADDAAEKLAAVLENSRHAYSQLTLAPRCNEGEFRHASELAEAVKGADLIIESVPERLDIKQSVYAEIEKYASTTALITSSTSGILPSDLQQNLNHPQRFLVAHPFNPVYLIPLVEIVAGKSSSAENIQRASDFFTQLGMRPLLIKKEIEAFVADRLLEAVWRESLWLVKDGIATTADIDDAIRFGFGLRWAQMGLFETYRIAGGEAGMRHFMEQFGPCLSWPWTKLMDVPEFNDALVDLIAEQSDQQSGHFSIRELERIRDDNLIAILQALKLNQWGAGKSLEDYEQRLLVRQNAAVVSAASDEAQPLITLQRKVPPGWTDYNNHMNESRYLQCFSEATDNFMQIIGADQPYIDAGNSYFTVETHMRHLDEVNALASVYVTTQVLHGEGKKMHLFHRLLHADGRLLATGEHMLIHVNLQSRRASVPGQSVLTRLQQIATLHAALEMPEGAGKAIA